MRIRASLLGGKKCPLETGVYLVVVNDRRKAACVPISRNEAKAVLIRIGDRP